MSTIINCQIYTPNSIQYSNDTIFAYFDMDDYAVTLEWNDSGYTFSEDSGGSGGGDIK